VEPFYPIDAEAAYARLVEERKTLADRLSFHGRPDWSEMEIVAFEPRPLWEVSVEAFSIKAGDTVTVTPPARS
jgi:hypothetical protein